MSLPLPPVVPAARPCDAWLAELQAQCNWLRTHEDGHDLIAPTPAAMQAAGVLLNRLPVSCLAFRMAVSHDGEINLFFDNGPHLFQVHIAPDGGVSHHGVVADQEVGASDQAPEAFPCDVLAAFVAR